VHHTHTHTHTRARARARTHVKINYLPVRINSVPEPIVCDSLSSRNFEDFCSMLNLVLSRMIKRFVANNSVLKLDKTKIFNSLPPSVKNLQE
jgi:hypothetical protein